MVDKKLYVHGGIGAIAKWEGFGNDYDLRLDCYSETCASIGLLFLGKQMLQHRLSREVAKVMERALYNNILGSVSLDGRQFLFNQPLEADGSTRSDWFHVSCCPPNVSRLFNSLESYLFTESKSLIAINFYIGSRYNADGVEINITTKYPWEGVLDIELCSEREIAIAIRAPSGKYKTSFQGIEKNGYIHFSSRKWKKKLHIEFDIDFEILRPNPRVAATEGKLAVQRGRFVYAVEQGDSPVPLNKLRLLAFAKIEKKLYIVDNLSVIMGI